MRQLKIFAGTLGTMYYFQQYIDLPAKVECITMQQNAMYTTIQPPMRWHRLGLFHTKHPVEIGKKLY